jgi:hypothetical protein
MPSQIAPVRLFHDRGAESSHTSTSGKGGTDPPAEWPPPLSYNATEAGINFKVQFTTLTSAFNTTSTSNKTNTMSGPPAPPRSGMSLYANLLDPASDSSASASISRAPVLFKQSDDKDDAASKKPLDPGAAHSVLDCTTPHTLD